jgi:tetratricopeptide (TPR) repeat protein
MARIAMRNIATLFHSKEISPKILEKMKSMRIGKDKPLYLKKAEKWYEKSLELEDSQSAYQLGLLYESNFYGSINDRIEENKNKAENLFKKAVQFDKDNLYAKAKLGRNLINSNKKDISEGRKMMEDAAEKGLDMGQTYLGEFYEEAKNYEKAVEYYSKAARQNRGYYSHTAQCRLNQLKDKGLINEDTNIEDILENYRNECKYGYIEIGENFEKIS